MSIDDVPESVAPSFEWISVAHGWATFELRGEPNLYRCTVADSTDVFALVLRSADNVARGAQEYTFSLDHEPAEIRWILRRSGAALSITISVFREWGATNHGIVRFEGRWVDHMEFAREILAATEQFIARLGIAAFNEGWPTFPFPANELSRLREIVSE